MVTKKNVNFEALNNVLAKANAQVVVTGTMKTLDAAFPLFETPVNEDKLVYIPTTNTVSDENGTVMNMLRGHIHNCKEGKSFPTIRCINGLESEELGLDGTCPLCDAVIRAKRLRDIKFESLCKAEGIDPQNDPTGKYKDIYKRVCSDMPVETPVEKVAFPIVVIETEAGKFAPKKDGKIEAYWLVMTAEKYEKVFVSALSAMISAPSSPAGMFWAFQFTYTAADGKHNKRDSGKNAKYLPLTDAGSLKILTPFKSKCEEVAKDFTIEKAFQTITQFIPQSVEETKADASRIMKQVDSLLMAYDAQNAGVTPVVPMLGAMGGVQGALDTFGADVTGANATGDIGIAVDENTTVSL